MTKATERLPLTPETKRLIDEQKDDGMTYDLWLRRDPRVDGDGADR